MSSVNSITMVIVDFGDGSNGILWVKDPAVLAKMDELAAEGDGTYASGDGLQTKELFFPEGFDIDGWMERNYLFVTDEA